VTAKPHPQVVYHQLHFACRGVRALTLLVTAREDAAFPLLGTTFHLKHGSADNTLNVSETFSHI